MGYRLVSNPAAAITSPPNPSLGKSKRTQGAMRRPPTHIAWCVDYREEGGGAGQGMGEALGGQCKLQAVQNTLNSIKFSCMYALTFLDREHTAHSDS
jgi:hypothetical protein